MQVIMFPRHRLHNRRGTDCAGCFCCEGGLALCVTCGGAEASLPTHCPQARMDDLMQATVQDGSADFENGEWNFIERRRRDV